MSRLVPILLFLSACATPPPQGWTVTGGTPTQQVQALDLLGMGRNLHPGTLGGDGGIAIVSPSDMLTYCLGPYNGCAYTSPEGRATAVVLDVPDLTLSALPHELCHLISNTDSQVSADTCGTEIVTFYRKAHP